MNPQSYYLSKITHILEPHLIVQGVLMAPAWQPFWDLEQNSWSSVVLKFYTTCFFTPVFPPRITFHGHMLLQIVILILGKKEGNKEGRK